MGGSLVCPPVPERRCPVLLAVFLEGLHPHKEVHRPSSGVGVHDLPGDGQNGQHLLALWSSQWHGVPYGLFSVSHQPLAFPSVRCVVVTYVTSLGPLSRAISGLRNSGGIGRPLCRKGNLSLYERCGVPGGGCRTILLLASGSLLKPPLLVVAFGMTP